ncbi:MAG: hypothetical protein M3308_08375 [Actinomycetota bacterium]|nr:hypothetical protein [Actinomycetota bacterium]
MPVVALDATASLDGWDQWLLIRVRSQPKTTTPELRQNVSGCLRTLTGAKQFCTIRNYLSTAAKHHRPLFDTLVTLAEGQPWMPATA